MLASQEIKNKNIIFNMVAGHSLGEISALTVAGVINIEDALKIIKVRASKMESSGIRNPEKMLALINADEEQVAEIYNIESIVVANVNSPKQIVVSGQESKINEAVELSKKSMLKEQSSNVSGAFHSPLMSDVG